MKIELVLNKKNPDPDQVRWLEVRSPNQGNRLDVYARYFFIFGSRIGIIIKPGVVFY